MKPIWIMLRATLAVSLLARVVFAQDQKRIQDADRKFAEGMQSLVETMKGDPKEEERNTKAAKQEWDKMRKAGGEQFRGFVKFAQMSLGRFGYAVGPFTGALNDQTKQAVREYQQYNKLPVTGDLDWDTNDRIMRDFTTLEERPPSIPVNLVVLVDDWHEYVAAKGTWVMLNEKIAHPYNTASVTCYRAKAICIASSADIVDLSTGQVFLTQDMWEVQRWDEYEIVTQPIDGVCDRSVLRINRATKEVGITSSTKLVAGVCKAHPDVLTRLENGSDVWKGGYGKYEIEKNRIMRGAMSEESSRSTLHP